MSQTTAAVTPARVMQTGFGFIASRAVNAAIELDLFTHIHHGAHTLEDLARAANASPRGIRMLIDALVGLGLIQRDGGILSLPPDSEMFLVRDSRGFIGNVLHHVDLVWQNWSKLSDAVRQGTAIRTGVETTEDDGKFFSQWVDGLFNLNFPAAQAAAARLGPGARDVLDIGAGSGVWSLAFAAVNPDVQVVAVDRKDVVDQVSRPFVERMGAASRYSFRVGDFREVDLGTEAFDVAILGHILHSEGLERSNTLLSRVYRSLRPGGRLLVAEMVPDDAHSQDIFALLFGLNMLLLTESGDVFSRRELEAMMHSAGFTECEWLEAPAPYPLLIATRGTGNLPGDGRV